VSETPEEHAGLSPERVAELLESGEIDLIDVREEDEWEAGHIPGARHIPLNDLTSRSESIDREKPVVFYCRGGGRSGMAAEAFRNAGYDAEKLAGGMVIWAESKNPIEPEDGTVIDHAGFPPE